MGLERRTILLVARTRWLLLCLLAGCGSGKKDEAGGPAASAPGGGPDEGGAGDDACPASAPAPQPLPGTDAVMADFGYWSGRIANLDAPVLPAAEIPNLVAAHGGTAGAPPAQPLTRRAWYEAAFALVGKPASGDPIGGMLQALGVPAGGSFAVDLAGVKNPEDRLLVIDAAAEAGIVLLEVGDRRMIWLGRDQAGQARVLHALDYGARCLAALPGARAETRMEVGKVVVSGLELGTGSAAGSLLDQITRVVYFARTTGAALSGVAVDRPAAPVQVPKRCKDSDTAAIFFSPWQPSVAQPLRVIATLSKDPGPIGVTLIDPKGVRTTPEPVRLGGPPWSYVVTVDAPVQGKWTAVLGDGSRVSACDTVKVGSSRHKRKGTEATVWSGSRGRSEALDNYFAAFVERLFDYPVEEDLTWKNLHTLLRDKDRNILYDHLGFEEDDKLFLDPDCADLPYLLHAYFAWKVNLPFAWLTCSKISSNKPPKCKGAMEEMEAAAPNILTPDQYRSGDNRMSRVDFKKKDDVGAFQEFIRTKMFPGVSSTSGRTAPDDDLTDWYPVALTREALRPGTMFADPYGHLLVIVGWYPQKPGGYGMLMGADAQPDATIGRRRFWRGNYLFTSDTKRAGAGFKAYRPRARTAAGLEPWENRRLRRNGWWVELSEQQYAGSTDDFYDTMEALINPRPLDALQMQVSLVDALQEAVVRRVNSVDSGEKYMATAPEPIEMPEGAKIFLTSGPWEDYSTPARDHRILVAIDTVLGLTDAVKRRPERYRLSPGAVDDMVGRLQKNLETLLTSRTFTYTRSDGVAQTLTLKDVVDRAPGFEISYNPNDCAEIRWGAPEGSAEMNSCTRRAPPEQRALMEKYRIWFKNRERPE